MGVDRMYQDDSMFVNAMNDAVMKYKIMHGHDVVYSAADGGGVFDGCGGKIDDPKRSVDEDSNIEINDVYFEVNGTSNTSEANENITVEPCPISCTDFSDVLHLKETQQEQPIEDYNQLLKQYHELEEKRQKILEQLYRCGAHGLNYNYQDVSSGFDIGSQRGTSSAYQENPVSARQPSHNHAIPSIWPSSNPILAGTGPQSSSLPDGDIIKTAMDSAARTISSVNTVNKEKESKTCSGIIPQSGASSETDLTPVLNAWYNAGFYTGQYLMEQSYAKKQ